jgi:hypothetical protein
MSRLDHRLAARIAPYRLARHVARVILIGVFLTPSTISPLGRSWIPRSSFELRLVLADRRIYVVILFWAIVAHLILVRAKGFHAKWDRGLEFVRLRPKSL